MFAADLRPSMMSKSSGPSMSQHSSVEKALAPKNISSKEVTAEVFHAERSALKVAPH
jgi:hypothetical protein